MQCRYKLLSAVLLLFGMALFAACEPVQTVTVEKTLQKTTVILPSVPEITEAISFPDNEADKSTVVQNEPFSSAAQIAELTMPAEEDWQNSVPEQKTSAAQSGLTLPESIAAGGDADASAVLSPSAEAGETTASESEILTAAEIEPAEVLPPYDFSAPVPAGEQQDISYFDDAVFIGNSRMVGFGAYSGLKNITVYAHSGLNIRSIYDDVCIETESGKITIPEALRQKPDCKKIYLKMGTNELGWPYYDVFIKEYVALIEELKVICPDALIYVHSILPVSKKKSEGDTYENQTNINICNSMLQTMCEENQYFYLDVASAYLDEEGYLFADVTFDGSHIRYPHYQAWVDYLLSHTVEGSNTLLPAEDAEAPQAEGNEASVSAQPSELS